VLFYHSSSKFHCCRRRQHEKTSFEDVDDEEGCCSRKSTGPSLQGLPGSCGEADGGVADVRGYGRSRGKVSVDAWPGPGTGRSRGRGGGLRPGSGGLALQRCTAVHRTRMDRVPSLGAVRPRRLSLGR